MSSGVYKRILNFTTEFLRKNINTKNKAIVFDLDDTLVNTRSKNSPSFVPTIGMVEMYDRIPEMVELLKRAKIMGYSIFIITARTPNSEFIVVQNLQEKIPEILPLIDNIFASPIPIAGNIEEFKKFKAVLRRNLELIDLNAAKTINSWQLYNLNLRLPFKNTLNIVLTIGDQPFDIAHMSHYGLLLPRPERNPTEAFLYKRVDNNHDDFVERI